MYDVRRSRSRNRDFSYERGRRSYSRDSSPDYYNSYDDQKERDRDKRISHRHSSTEKRISRSRSKENDKTRDRQAPRSRSRERSNPKHPERKRYSSRSRWSRSTSFSRSSIKSFYYETPKIDNSSKSSERNNADQTKKSEVSRSDEQKKDDDSPELDEDTLQAIGKRLTSDKVLADPIHKDIEIRWKEIHKDGLPKEERTELFKKYYALKNCSFIQAPLLNKEIVAALHDKPAVKNRDSRLLIKQEKVTVCLSAVSLVLSKAIKKHPIDNLEMIKALSDGCRILVDLQCDDSSKQLKPYEKINKSKNFNGPRRQNYKDYQPTRQSRQKGWSGQTRPHQNQQNYNNKPQNQLENYPKKHQ